MFTLVVAEEQRPLYSSRSIEMTDSLIAYHHCRLAIPAAVAALAAAALEAIAAVAAAAAATPTATTATRTTGAAASLYVSLLYVS